jgi:hypothetical protein
MTMAERVADVSTMVPWRRSRLRRAGFGARRSAALAADLRYDVWAMLELIDRGCPPELAARIVAPLEDAG